MKHRIIDQHGLTLIEIIISFAILLILAVPLLGGLVQGYKIKQSGSELQRMIFIAQSILEEYKSGEKVGNQTGNYDHYEYEIKESPESELSEHEEELVKNGLHKVLIIVKSKAFPIQKDYILTSYVFDRAYLSLEKE